MVGAYVVNSFSSKWLRAHQNFCRQFGKIFIQAGLLRIDQWSFFSPEGRREVPPGLTLHYTAQKLICARFHGGRWSARGIEVNSKYPLPLSAQLPIPPAPPVCFGYP